MITFSFITTLLIIAFQDFKERKVTILLLILGVILGGLLFYQKTLPELFLLSIILNFTFLGLLTVILFFYSRLVLKKELLKSIGLGDFLFLGILAISFPTITFLILFSTSLIFSLVLFLFLKPKLQDKTVPLAGFQAFFLAIVLLINKIFSFVDLYAL